MEKQKGATARALTGLVNDLTDKQLLVLTASENRPALKTILRNPQASIGGLAQKASSFGLVVIPGVKKFVVADHFGKQCNNIDIEVKDGGDFKKLFFDKVEKFEGSETVLAYQTLSEPVMYDTAFSKLTKSQAEINTYEIYALIELQENCKKEMFLKKSDLNGFLSRCTRGRLHVVVVFWQHSRWCVGIGSLEGGYSFIPGDRIYYRHFHF